MTKPKESIVFIFCDQWRSDCLSLLGHPFVRTPQIDALAKDSVTFRNVITPSPICMPARMSFFTGLYAHQTGIANNGTGLWPETPNFVRQVREAGYTTACRGKLHLFWRHDNELLMSDGMLRTFGWSDPMEIAGKCSHGRLRASAYTEFLRSRGKLDAHFEWLWQTVQRSNLGVSHAPSILPEDEQIDGWVMDRGLDFVRAHPERDEPFLLWVGPEGPHDPYDPPGEWANLYDPAEMDLPIREFSTDPVGRTKGEGLQVKHANDDAIRQMRAHYYGNISFIDHKIGQVVETLKAQGRYDDTWVVFSADHGELLGDFHCTGKGTFNRGSVEVPLVIKPPRRYEGCPRGTISEALLELNDVGATFMDIASTSLDGHHGRSLLPLLSGDTDIHTHRDVARSQIDNHHMLQVEGKRLIYDTQDFRSLDSGHTLIGLFDLENDPQELHNLLPEHTAEAQALFDAHEPAFFAGTTDRLPPQWEDAPPYQTWGRYPLVEHITV